MKNLRKNKGITIVSLVVTVILLIILAGVSMNLIVGDSGVITVAKRSKENLQVSVNEEQERLAQLTNSLYSNSITSGGGTGGGSEGGGTTTLPDNTPSTKQGTIVKLPSEWEGQSTISYVSTEDGSIVKSETKVASVYAVSAGNGETLPVPNGFYYVGGTISSGAVISDSILDKNKYVYTNAVEGNVPAGVEYNADGTVNEEESPLKGNQFVWIPCTLENYTKVNFGVTNSSGWDTSTNTAEEAQIRKYGGFYVGRYEAGTSDIVLANGVSFENSSTASGWQNGNFVSSKVESGKITCKAGEIPYYHADYATAVEMCKNMYNTESVNSGLMTGTMWDVMMKFVTTDDTSYSDLKSTAWGNYYNNTSVQYTSGTGRYLPVNSSNGSVTANATVSDSAYHYGIRTSASSEGVKRNNLYDIAGNLWEWTQETAYYSSNTNLYLLRGGSFCNSYSDDPVCSRAYRSASYTNTPTVSALHFI